MIWTEATVGSLLSAWLNRKYLVICPNTLWTGYETDMLAVTDSLRLIDFEIKISRADFRRDRGKDKWLKHAGSREGPPYPRTHPEKIWKHYYVVPTTIWDASLIAHMPEHSGLLLLREGRRRIEIDCERKSKPNRAAKPLDAAQAIDIARLTNLRYWELARSLEKES